mgnify:CR=1 FL=1
MCPLSIKLPIVPAPIAVKLPNLTLEYVVVAILPVVEPVSVVVKNANALSVSFQPINWLPDPPRVKIKPKSYV